MSIELDVERFGADWVGMLKAKRLRSNAVKGETSLHRAADKLAPRFESAVKLAFSLARRSVSQSNPKPEQATKVLKAALGRVMPKLLREAYVAGGNEGAVLLRTAAEFDESKHQRDDAGRFTDGGNIDANVKELTRATTVPHYTDGDKFVISTRMDRLIPNSGSLGQGGQEFGTKRVDVTLKVGTKVYDVTPKVWDSFYGENEEATPLEIGRRIRERAVAVGAQVVKIDGRIHGLGTEWAVLDPSAVQKQKLRTLKKGDQFPQRRGPISFTFDAASEEAISWADKHAAELIDGISETTREAINNAIAESLEEGTDPYDAILEAVGSPERARRIAHHEPMLAVHEGQREAWRQAVDDGLLPADAEATWIVTGDDKVCPICVGLEDQTRGIDGEYEFDGEEYSGPPAHVGCRCTEGLTVA